MTTLHMFIASALLVGCATKPQVSPEQASRDKAFADALASANQNPNNIALQIEAIKRRVEARHLTAGEAYLWIAPIAPVLARVDRDGATCDELEHVASAYARLAYDGNVGAEVKRAAQLWSQCPRVEDAQQFQFVFKRLAACDDYVSIVASLWPQATDAQQRDLIQTVEWCSTPENRLAHLSFLPADRLVAYEDERVDREQRDEVTRIQELQRDMQRDISNACWGSCASSYDSCIQACSGDCTVCNNSKQRCLQGCPASP